jgi:hypothetical protein
MVEPTNLGVIEGFTGFDENGKHSFCIVLSLSFPFGALRLKLNVAEHFPASAHMFSIAKHYSAS